MRGAAAAAAGRIRTKTKSLPLVGGALNNNFICDVLVEMRATIYQLIAIILLKHDEKYVHEK